MEEATGAPSSFAVCKPRRLRASGRDGGGVVNRPPSPLTMLLSRHTRRREFITFVGGLAVTAPWPIVARAQQAGKIYRIGFLANDPSILFQPAWRAFIDGLRESGFIEGKNITIEPRFAEARLDRYDALFAELIRLQADVIVTSADA